ncbi:hypothetical protein BD770DRAFT_123755 [Pilaira anomala]|nr:hypothetical protein BD770DRAFT_123755 [Pilaira anomala]
MPYSVQCPNCSDIKIHDKKITGLYKCPSCRVVYLPKPINQDNSSLQSKDNKRGEPEKASKSLLNNMISINSVKSNSTKAPAKTTTDKKFVLEFSDDDDDEIVDLSSLKLSKSLNKIKAYNENAKKILRRPTRPELDFELSDIESEDDTKDKVPFRPPTTTAKKSKTEIDLELSDVESVNIKNDKTLLRRPKATKTTITETKNKADFELSDVESVDIKNNKALFQRSSTAKSKSYHESEDIKNKKTSFTHPSTRQSKLNFAISDVESVDVKNDKSFSVEKTPTATRQKRAVELSSGSESDEEPEIITKANSSRPRREKKSVSVSLDFDIEEELTSKTSGKKRALEDDEYVGNDDGYDDNYDNDDDDDYVDNDDEYEDEFERDFFTEQQKKRPGSGQEDKEGFLSSTHSNQEEASDTIGGKKVVRLNFKNDPLFTRRMDEENDHQNKDTSPSEDPLFSDMDEDMDEDLPEQPKTKKRAPRKPKPKATVEPGGVLQTKIFRSGMEKDKTIDDSRLPNPDKPKKRKRLVRRFGAKPGNRFNPFILFNKEYRSQIKEANPHLDYLELNQLVGKTFRELGPVSFFLCIYIYTHIHTHTKIRIIITGGKGNIYEKCT